MEFQEWWDTLGKRYESYAYQAAEEAWDAAIRSTSETSEAANSAVALLRKADAVLLWYENNSGGGGRAMEIRQRIFRFLNSQPCHSGPPTNRYATALEVWMEAYDDQEFHDMANFDLYCTQRLNAQGHSA